jgi:hypothetical protein
MKRAQKKPPRLKRFRVYQLDDPEDSHRYVGSVLLAEGASPSHVEHALAAVGIYAPRGLDELLWSRDVDPGDDLGFGPRAVIVEAGQGPIVLLSERAVGPNSWPIAKDHK